MQKLNNDGDLGIEKITECGVTYKISDGEDASDDNEK